MSELAIELEHVSKMYRLYRAPRYRILEALGLPVPATSYDEFWPMRNLSLKVVAGERVGLVGRNGAGKSTMLKLIAGLLQPTKGRVTVHGKVQALMELGTGFHPEFTGRENVLSSFAYQGITGAAASRLLDDVLDFSELEDFIDKPVKTYSAGMYSRLAFAASTAVRPEILIIDEILGAGDAYFAGKSAKRMRRLTSEGSTVLFVSHDMSAVQMICNRAVWIERGRIVSDGDPIEVGRAYAASIRKQEELRLRAINLKLGKGDVSELLTDSETDRVFVLRLVTTAGGPPRRPLKVYECALLHADETFDKVQLGQALDDDRGQRVHVLTGRGYMQWSGPQSASDGRSWREFRDCQGTYGHAPLSIRVPLGLGAVSEFKVRLEHGGALHDEEIVLQKFDGEQYVTLGVLQPSADGDARVAQVFALTQQEDVPIETASAERVPAVAPTSFTYGVGSVTILGVEFLNRSGQSQRVFSFNDGMIVKIDWRVHAELQRMSFVVCVYGMDGACVSQVVSPITRASRTRLSGSATARFDPLMIGAGDYVVSVAIFEGLTESDLPGAEPLAAVDRNFRIKVVAPDDVRMQRGLVVHPVVWSVN